MDFVLLDGNKVESLDCEVVIGSGLFSGVRVMTSMLTIGRTMIDVDRHLTRLQDHLEVMGMKQSNLKDYLQFDLEKCLIACAAQRFLRVRIVLFNDLSGKFHRLISVSAESTEIVKTLREKGTKISLHRDVSWVKGAHVKTGLIGMRQTHIDRIKAAGFDDVLWVNGDNEITEATWSNIFLIGRTGDLVEIATPPASSGILEGITRQRVIELLEKAKIPVTVRIITEDEIPRFDEAFLTSSIRGVVPLNQIGSHRLHTLRPNAVFHHIARLYQTWLSTQLSSNSNGLPMN